MAVIGEPVPGSTLNVRLYKAALRAFRDLAEYGFRPVDTDLDSYRGATVSFTDGLRLVTISADWIEGEIDVSVREAGSPARSLEDIVPEAVASSLHLSRIGAAPTKGMLTSRLLEVTRALRLLTDLLTRHCETRQTRRNSTDRAAVLKPAHQQERDPVGR